jgi:hypothetical protein
MSNAGMNATRELAARYVIVANGLTAQEPSTVPVSLAEEGMSLMVDARLEWTSTQVLDELNECAPGFLAEVEAMQAEHTALVANPMSELGTYPLHSLADAFTFMKWGTHRALWRDHVTVTGEADYVTRVLDSINVI